MTLDSLINDMVNAAADYPGIDLIMYRTAVTNTVNIVSTFVGIAAVTLTIGLPIILALELMFLNYPPLTAFLVDRENRHMEAGVEKKHRNWGLFLNDARKALRMQAEEGINVNMCYLKVKWVTLFCVGTSVTLLFSGQDTIVRLVTKLIGPILVRLASI